MAWVLTGGFLLLSGAVFFGVGVHEGSARFRGKPDSSITAVLLISASGAFVALACGTMKSRDAEWAQTAAAPRVGFAVFGALLVAGAAAVWMLAPRMVENESDGFGADPLLQRPAEAEMRSVWQTLGPKGSAAALAVLGAIVAAATFWPDVVDGMLTSWSVLADVLKILSFGFFILLGAVMIATGMINHNRSDVAYGAFFLFLWAIGITVGLLFGKLNAWIDILKWISGLVT